MMDAAVFSSVPRAIACAFVAEEVEEASAFVPTFG